MMTHPTPSRRDALEQNLLNFSHEYPAGHEVRQFFEMAGCQIIFVRRLRHISSWPWQLNVRLARELEDEFGFSREFMLLATSWGEFQMRSLDTLREAVQLARRVEPEAAAVITSDEGTIDKAYEWCGNDFTVLAFSPRQIHAAVSDGGGAPLTAIRKALQGALFGRNFYDESGPVSGERFFGRSILLNQLRSDFANHKTVGLFGLRKIGKTSVTQGALARLTPGDIGVYIDLGGERIHGDARHIFVTMMERLRAVDVAAPPPRNTWDHEPAHYTARALEWLENKLGRLQAAKQSFVLALDELEAVVPTMDHSGLACWEEVLAALRSLWQGYRSFQLAFVGVNPSVFEQPSIASRDNPVFSFVRPTYVKCMSQLECDRMVTQLGKRTGVRWPPEVLTTLYEQTGGHPYLTRQVCAVVVAGLTPPETVTVEMLESRLAEVLLTRHDIFAEIFDSLRRHFPAELDLLERIAREDSIAVPSLGVSELSHLLGYELVTLNGGVATQRIALLNRWLRGQ